MDRLPGALSLDDAGWIWFPEGDPGNSAPAATRYFRRDVELPDQVSAGRLLITADDHFVLYLNGTKVAESPQAAEAWRQAQLVDLALLPGGNVIAIAATNTAVNPAGLIARLRIEGQADLVTDTTWASADEATPGWEQPDFNDSSWRPALEIARYGDGPWGRGVSAPGSPEPLLRKDFTADRSIASARAYVAGLGYYQLYVNGKRIGDHQLDPAFTVYDKTVLYATYDVTSTLRRGGNAIGVRLGRGYYGMLSPGGWTPGPSAPWHGEPTVKLQLDLTYRDGSTERIVSDNTWKLACGPTLSDSVINGESYDARLEQPGWDRPGFDDNDWLPATLAAAPAGTLQAQALPPIKVTGRLQLKGIRAPKDGVRVYDFGTPTAGWARVELRGPRGSTVTIRYGEKLNADGTVDNAGVQVYTYTLKGGGTESYRPSYSYNGFRYVEVDTPKGVSVRSVQGERVHTAVARTGNFSSSSTLLNRYHRAQADTILNNLHSIPTDTPMYEKRGYTADAHLNADSSIANYDLANFYEKWMRDHRDEQFADGTIDAVVPSGGGRTVDPVWSASYVLICWDLYWHYGITRVLDENYQPMLAWLDYFETAIAQTGYIYTGFSFGDWVAPGHVFPPEGTRLVGTGYLYRTATTLAKIARVLGKHDDAVHLDTLAARVANAFNARFLDTTAKAYYDDRGAGYRQTSNLIPLSLGLVPDADRQAVLANLVDDIEKRGNHLNTGALGTKVILPVLTDAGHAELAYAVATNPTYPGWGYWFRGLGVTTMWEQWEESSRSHDHAFLGTVDDWLYQHVAGIQATGPGYATIRIRPSPVGGLTHAAARVASPLGEVSSDWTRHGDRFTLRVVVPVGATAEILVPARDRAGIDAPADATFVAIRDGYAAFQVGSGTHTVTTMTPE